MEKRLMVYGDLAVDILAQVEHLGQAGQDTAVEDISFTPGGSAANCAVVASHLGIPCTFLGMIGDDYWGQSLIEDLQKFGVNTNYLVVAEGNSATTLGIVSSDGERTFYSYRGVAARLPFPEISTDLLSHHDCVHLTGYSFQGGPSQEAAQSLARLAKKHGLKLSLDPSFQFSKNFQPGELNLLADIDYIFPNRIEARYLTGKENPIEAAAVLHSYGPKIVIIKLDKDGCFVSTKENRWSIPAHSASHLVDTTGAGDAFCGGFLAGLFWGLEPGQAAKIGNAAAFTIVGQKGGHSNPPNKTSLIETLIAQEELELAQKVKSI